MVNHSMGGLVSQYYLKVLGGNPDVSHLASIAGANHGTTAAGACLAFVTCQQMYPGSSFIARTSAGDETPGCETHIGFLTDTTVLNRIATFVRA